MTIAATPMNGLFNAEYFDIYSSHVKDTFRIFIAKPSLCEDAKKYPAIYALDGNASFPSLMSTQRLLTQGSEVPPSFVVGIGYPGKTLMEAMANRNRDYAPTEPGETEAICLGVAAKAGGPAFLKFIQDELKPLLAEHYPIDENDSTLQGVSLGGLFAAWVLLTEPKTFRNYILCSPAIWWREEQVWEWEETFAREHTELPANVFIGAGALEVTTHLRRQAQAIADKNPIMREHAEKVIRWSDAHGWPVVAELTPQFASRLQSRVYQGLTIHCQNMPDENHMSAPPALTSRGLRYVFGSWRP